MSTADRHRFYKMLLPQGAVASVLSLLLLIFAADRGASDELSPESPEAIPPVIYGSKPPPIGLPRTISDLGIELMPVPAVQNHGPSWGAITITRAYWLGKTEVTQAQWQAIMGCNPSYFKGDSLPVEQVSWHDCVEFCRKLTERERTAGRLPVGYSYRLPTAREWSSAACGGNRDMGYQSRTNLMLHDMGWFDGNSEGRTWPVGKKKPNELGLHDMGGNVWEWCHDWCWWPKSGLPRGHAKEDSTGPERGVLRIACGGSWRSRCSGYDTSISSDSGVSPSASNHSLGFRICLGVDLPGMATPHEPVRPDANSNSAIDTVATDNPLDSSRTPSRKITDLDIELMPVPAGSFKMGPQYYVTLSRCYWLGRTEVTRAQWFTVMDYPYRDMYFRRDSLPIAVGWRKSVEFCRKLTEREQAAGRLPPGYAYRLPTEAEWEYAARGGPLSKGYEYSGSNCLNEVGWEKNNDCDNVVAQKMPNELGIYDMSGNVSEWCHDWYGDYPSGNFVDPIGPDNGKERVVRGDSFGYGDNGLYHRVDRREKSRSDEYGGVEGFRICLGPELAEATSQPSP